MQAGNFFGYDVTSFHLVRFVPTKWLCYNLFPQVEMFCRHPKESQKKLFRENRDRTGWAIHMTME